MVIVEAETRIENQSTTYSNAESFGSPETALGAVERLKILMDDGEVRPHLVFSHGAVRTFRALVGA